MIDIIKKYFPDLSPASQNRFELMEELYREWNAKINVISRKDIDNLEINHLLHSLAVYKFLRPEPGTSFLDVGTGGGFPGLPLAVMCPGCSFLLLDRIQKKLNVVSDIARRLGLDNVAIMHGDLGECKEKVNYVVSRAAMDMSLLVKLSRKNVSAAKSANIFPNGILALKGGDLQSELALLRSGYVEENISVWFGEPFFETKKIIYVPVNR